MDAEFTKYIVGTCIPKFLEIIQKWDMRQGNIQFAEVTKDVMLEALVTKIRGMSLKDMMASMSYLVKDTIN